MSTPNPLEAAAVPALVAALQAVQAFISNLGTDPAQVAVKARGAIQVLIGTLEMQIPVLAAAELSAAQSDINAKIGGWVSKLQGLAAPKS